MAVEGIIIPQRLRALRDPQLLRDPRVLFNLLAREKWQRIDCAGVQCAQPEVTEDMVDILAHWLLEVCEDQQCQHGVFSLAMSYIRKFLYSFPLGKRQLQHLGTVCVLLASKMKDSEPLKVKTLEIYTACSVPASDIRHWEVYMLHRLNWELEIVIAHDFLDQIMERLLLPPVTFAPVRRHSQIYMTICSLDHNIIASYAPSVIAAACVATALFKLGLYLHVPEKVISFFASIIQAKTVDLLNCLTKIEPALKKALETSHKYRRCLAETTAQALPYPSAFHC